MARARDRVRVSDRVRIRVRARLRVGVRVIGRCCACPPRRRGGARAARSRVAASRCAACADAPG